MGVLNLSSFSDYRMISVIEFESKGKRAFALRKKMKALEETVCLLWRNPLNQDGEGCCNL